MTNKKNFKIWVPVDIMKDPRTVKLLSETGYKGFGVLIAAIIAVDQFYMTQPTITVIVNLLNGESSRGFCKRILCDYGFFNIDQEGYITSLLRADTRAQARESVRAQARESVRTEVRESVRADLSLSKAHIHNQISISEDNAHTHTQENFSNSLISDECKTETERKFDSWLSKLSNILMMQEPLTYSQFGDLVQLGFPAKQVRQTAERLNNYSNAYRKYSSAFLTIKDWLEHPLPRGLN